MASISNALPFPVGTTSTSGTFLGSLGQLYKTYDTTYGERIFRLAFSGGAIPANCACLGTVSSGRKTYTVTAVTTTSPGASSQVAGVVPIEYTSTIAASSYFLLQVGGNCPVLAGDTLFSSLSGVESRLVVGSGGTGFVRQLAAFTTASTTEEMGVFALASNTVAATAVGVAVRALLRIALDD